MTGFEESEPLRHSGVAGCVDGVRVAVDHVREGGAVTGVALLVDRVEVARFTLAGAEAVAGLLVRAVAWAGEAS